MMEQMCILSFLGINSYLDLHKRQVSLLSVGFYAVLGIPYLILNRERLVLLLVGVVPGLLLLCLAKASGGAVGFGDGLVVLVSGLYMGIWKTLEWSTLALLLAAVWAGFLLACKKKGRKASFPFVPFLMAAYVISLLVKAAEGVEG